MNNQIILLTIQVFIVALILWMLYTILSYAKKHDISLKEKFWTGFGIGYVTDLLDTLGIGTFATTTTMFKLTKLVEDDRKIPATMTTAHIIPVLVEALLFITIVEVDMVTLIAMQQRHLRVPLLVPR